MVRPLKTINLVMASYSDVYCRSSRLHKLATSFLSSHKYFMNPELRAKQVRKDFTTSLDQLYGDHLHVSCPQSTACH